MNMHLSHPLHYLPHFGHDFVSLILLSLSLDFFKFRSSIPSPLSLYKRFRYYHCHWFDPALTDIPNDLVSLSLGFRYHCHFTSPGPASSGFTLFEKSLKLPPIELYRDK
jgi:hypothetical protein